MLQRSSSASQSIPDGGSHTPPPTPQNPLGLKTLHEPKATNSDSNVVDVIIVHGLGGSARDTWIHPSSKGFWPDFLHEEDNFSNIRISTFGYDSNFGNIFRANNVLDISSFAKQLLDHLSLHYEKYGDVVFFESASYTLDTDHICRT